MDYQLYEILVFFSVYSILGWCMQQCYGALFSKRNLLMGVSKGPWVMSFGLGAFIVPAGTEYLGVNPVSGFILGMLTGIILEFLSKVFINGLYGGKRMEMKWYEPLLFGFGGVILCCHLHPLFTEIVRWMNPWIHFIFLCCFWLNYPGEFIEGVYALTQHKKENRTFQKRTE